jgi:hypothetical protein
MIGFLPVGGIRGLNTNENDNQYTKGSQPVLGKARKLFGARPATRTARLPGHGWRREQELAKA